MSNLQSLSPTEIAFVDVGVADSSSLIAQFQAGTEVHLLDTSQDAIEQITQVLANRTDVSAVHLVSHGRNGALQLGGEIISNLSEYDAELQQWSDSLTADADILLYGCSVAANAAGVAFVQSLAQLTGADVAASDDLTGQGGDWNLEYQTGSIETAAIADTTYQGTLANFFVTSTADTVDANDNVLTLREAITAANNQAGTDNIFFSVNGTITLTGGELGISSDVNIYGNGAPFVTISGNNASRVFNVSSGTVLLSGLTITDGNAGFDNGGGILNNGTLTVQFSTLQNNRADEGGGIFNNGTLTVTGSSLTGNQAAFEGGGIFNLGSASVFASTFTENSTDNDGGGINNERTLTVTGSTFIRNSAGSDGGGINQEEPGSSSTVTGSTFRENSANDTGGGIRSLAGNFTVNNSIFQNNQAVNAGGGLSNEGSSVATVTGSTFIGNTTDGNGGGINNRSSDTLTLIANLIQQNSAVNGGGVFSEAGSTTNLRANNIALNIASAVGVDLNGDFTSQGFNVIGQGGGFSGIVNGVNGDVILVP